MISEKRLRANRHNAKKSTGPRTAAGKSRAGRNAIRHGLASVSLTSWGRSDRIAQIANKLCENDPLPYRYETALAIAESQILIDYIRRYRAVMIGKRKVRKVTEEPVCPPAVTTSDELEDFSRALPELASLERYERRALSRRRRAIRRFDALRD